MSDLLPQPLARSSPAARSSHGAPRRASTTTTHGRAAFALQRQLLLRARGALFARLESLGGVPTVADDAHQDALDARAAGAMGRALRGELQDALAHLAPVQQEHWVARAPAVLCFGARQHDELARLAAPASTDACDAAPIVALFQLTASLLDWIGDEHDEGTEVARLLPAGALPPLVGDGCARDDLLRRARDAGGAARAFATLLVALLERAERVARAAPVRTDTATLAALLGDAYDAELASFVPSTSRGDHVDRARRKSELPTLACGALAALALPSMQGATIERAAAALAPLLCIVDDLADLADDLRRGHLNTLAPAGAVHACDERAVERALHDVLADDTVERHAAEAAACIHRVHAVALGAGTPAVARDAILQWLRTRAWRWLS